jgi:hypothetical protein
MPLPQLSFRGRVENCPRTLNDTHVRLRCRRPGIRIVFAAIHSCLGSRSDR